VVDDAVTVAWMKNDIVDSVDSVSRRWMMSSTALNALELERRGPVAWITLNRPEVINAINDEIRKGAPRLLAQLDDDPQVRVIVICGAGKRGFCAGADLKEERQPALQTPGSQPVWIEAFVRVAKPVIASIHGYCLGGGLEIALACDVRIASPDATFGLPEPAIGLIPGGGGTQRLPRLIGIGRALDLLLTAQRIDAAEAYRIGLISRLTATQDELHEQTVQLAARIAALPPLAVRLAKEAARAGLERGLAEGLQLERELFARLLSTHDRREAAAAFREKREPVFTGS
jgi:enoyl-CoA hydratase/carnithine racemase